MNVQSLFYNLDSVRGLPEGDELADMQRRNPYYTKEGNLVITDPADIGQLMKAVAEDEFLPMDQFHQVSGTVSYCDVELEGGFHVSGILLLDSLKPTCVFGSVLHCPHLPFPPSGCPGRLCAAAPWQAFRFFLLTIHPWKATIISTDGKAPWNAPAPREKERT